MDDAKANLSILQKYLLSLSPHNPQWQPQMYNIAEDSDEDEEDSSDITEVNTSDATKTSCTSHIDPRPPISIILTPTAGRQMVAARNIKPGEILLREPAYLPLVPPSRADVDLRPTCVACLANLPDVGYAQCGGCGAPLCNSNCPLIGHSQDECQVLERLGMQIKEDPSAKLEAVKQCTALLPTLRVLQELEKRPDTKDLLWTMEANLTLRSKMPNGWQREQKILSNLRDNLQLNIDEDTVLRINGIFDTNSFEVPASESHNGRCRAFFPAVAMMNHSCIPNTQEWFTDNCMTIRAAGDIHKGSAVTLNYTRTLWGTSLRQDFLMHTKFFVCGCLRCRDPTEFGSHLSSFRCKKCGGMVVPPVTQVDKKTPWRCTGCKIVLPRPIAKAVLTAAAIRYSKVKCSDEASLQSAISIIERAIGPQHYTAVDLRYKLIKLMNKKLKDMSISELQDLVQMIHSFLCVVQLIVPKMSIFRGMVILYYVQAANQLLQKEDHTKTDSFPPSEVKNKSSIDIENTDNLNNNKNGLSHETNSENRHSTVEDDPHKPSASVCVQELNIVNKNIDENGLNSHSGIKNITLQDLVELTEESQNILLYSKKHQNELTDLLAILRSMMKMKNACFKTVNLK